MCIRDRRKVEPHDLVKFGLIPELIGRLPVITVLDDLDEDALGRVLKEPRNSLVKQYKDCLLYTSWTDSIRSISWQSTRATRPSSTMS